MWLEETNYSRRENKSKVTIYSDWLRLVEEYQSDGILQNYHISRETRPDAHFADAILLTSHHFVPQHIMVERMDS